MAPTAKTGQTPNVEHKCKADHKPKPDHKSKLEYNPKNVEPESAIPDPTPPYIMRKYTGTFRTKPTDASTRPKTVTISIAKYMLHLKHILTPVEIKKSAAAKPVAKAGENVGAAKPVKLGKDRAAKKPIAPKKAGILVTKATIKPKTATTPAMSANTATATAVKAIPPTPQTAIPTPASAAVQGPPISLFLNVNGVPQVRISGTTPEETALNADLQAVARTHPQNGLVSFDVREGEIRGVRVEREMYVRVVEGDRKVGK